MRAFLLSIGFLLILSLETMGQYYQTPFGHNRIQYKRFDWYYYSTNNFEVYYYPGGQEYAKEALNFLEEEFVDLTDILGYAPYTKTKIFIYNSIQDLQQSNIGIAGDVFTIGGKTDFVKLQVEMAYPGNAYDFRQEIINELGLILINDMMFGGSLAEIFQNSYLLSLPEWFIGGAAKYLSYGWSQEMDDYVREYLSRRNVKKLVKIQNEEAVIIGQSIWNYIAIKYGRSNLSNILNLTRIIRNEENSISSTLGISFKQFLSDWQNYYALQREEIEQNYRLPAEKDIVAGYRNHDIQLRHVSTNSNGDRVAYTFHKNGKFKVIAVNLSTGKEKTLVTGGYLINDQKIDYELPLIDWQDNETLGVIIYKRGNLYLNTYNVRSGKQFQKPLNRFRQIESFAFNDNGKLAVISGDVDGQNDLFLISMRRNALKRITTDLYDDLDPVFIPGTAAIVFSSNRVENEVGVSEVKLDAITNNYNLFVFDLDTTTQEFVRLTNTFSVDRHPIAKNQYEIYYLSDQKGITNLYRYSLLDSTFVQLSNFQYSITDYDLSYNEDKLTFMMLDQGRPKVFVESPFDLEQQMFTPQTGRQRMEQAKFISKRLPKKRLTPEPETKPEKELTMIDSLILPDSFFFKEDSTAATKSSKQDGDFIDTDNYVFEDEVKPSSYFRPESFFSNYRKLERESRVIGPQAYEPRFNFNNLITSFAIDPIRGFSILLESEISDLLDNHRLIGGVLTRTDFRSGDIFAEYHYLKYWMDFHLKFNRNTYIIDPNVSFLRSTPEEDLIQKYTLNKFEFGAAVPLNNSLRLELTPFYASTTFNNLQWESVVNRGSNLAPDSQTQYAGIQTALVIDNTIEKGFGLYQGTRGRIQYENYLSPTSSNRSFSRINIDLRHYQKIHREFTFATRIFYGRSMGNNQPQFLVGGMDNWLFNSYEFQGADDPLTMSNARDNSNILFTQFVTNLRGFDYNEIYGTNALVFNAELRLPIFRYLSSAPISSTFLRNFQLIGFYDLGSAWTGKPPFTRENSAFTKKYVSEGSAFSAELANFQNPWLASYGFGLRTVLLGYYLKIDLANPIKDFTVEDTRYHFTLGLDF